MSPLPFSTPPSPSPTPSISPFHLHIDEQKLQDMKDLVRLSPLAKDCFETRDLHDRELGVTGEWMREAKRVWLGEWEWREHEAHINTFPQFQAAVPDDDDGAIFSIHFVALFSERHDAIPLVFLHGWPGSFLEFLPLLAILRKKYTPANLPYHIIVPSLPGYTLSSAPPVDRDWHIAATARIIHKLVLQLGLREYVVQGGDIGAAIARTIAVSYAECKAVHLNYCQMARPAALNNDTLLSPREQAGLARYNDFIETGTAYGRMHGTRASTIAHVLASSPLALLAWLGEKFLAWSDVDPELDTILTAVSLYWLTDCFPTTVYPYRQDFAAGQRPAGWFHGQAELYVAKPLGFSHFPYEVAPLPRAWVETSGRLVSWREHEAGGHFAALERPGELLGDVEEFLGEVWEGVKGA
ncbi:hypothetical protein BDV95DRAFT_584598 [Massariosphaeria phaeospora]|uniref:Epoxide hydrolase N-terminal domain-containing protein n=1 Tax=Massariosphaeria phaeospora TaxID=100035 RepID=A0A7C8M0R4_9PLEO|nr:hypothetical protein BDV95DRAFT_584598 [Massariosphaeria phaeospora]